MKAWDSGLHTLYAGPRRQLKEKLKIDTVKKFEEKVSTKQRLVIAAAKLFAEKGFSDVSLRDITNAAGANVASVNYYFSSKETLIDEVIIQHIWPVNVSRMKFLDRLKIKYGAKSIPLALILSAFIEPILDAMQSSSLRNDLFKKIMGRCMGDRTNALPAAVKPQMEAVMKLFIFELKRTLPNLSSETLLWRLHFSFGAVAHTLLFSDKLEDYCGTEALDNPSLNPLDLLVDYCVGGLLAGEQADLREAVNR